MGFPCSTPHFFILLHHCGSQKSTSQVGIAEFSHPVCNTWAQKDESGWKQSSLCVKVFPVTKWITSCVCLFQFCTISWKSVSAFAAAFSVFVLRDFFSSFFFLLLLLHCWLLGQCLVLLCVVLWVVWIQPLHPCPGRGEVHMRPACICSLQQAAFALMCKS